MPRKRTRKQRKAPMPPPSLKQCSPNATEVKRQFARYLDCVNEQNGQKLALKMAMENLPPAEAERILKEGLLDFYNRFADQYDFHFEDTNHYNAIRKGIDAVRHYLRFPLMDITCGTGEVLKFVFDIIRYQRMVNTISENSGLHEWMKKFTPDIPGNCNLDVCANDFSPNMITMARRKLTTNEYNFLNIDFMNIDAAKSNVNGMKGKFATVICTQTFHIIHEPNQKMQQMDLKLARAIYEYLRPDGRLIISEEFPFLISNTSIMDVRKSFLDFKVQPYMDKGAFYAMLTAAGFVSIPEMEVKYSIDSRHRMYTAVFRKNGKS